MLQENMSEKLGIPYVSIDREDDKLFLCKSGVLFTKTEYRGRYPTAERLQAEHRRRLEKGWLYDYEHARNTGEIRKLREEASEPAPVPVSATAAATEKARRPLWNPVSAICLVLTVTSIGGMYISTVHTATYLFDYADTVSAWLMSFVMTAYCSLAFEVVVLFHERKRNFLAFVLAMLWLIVTLFSMFTTVSVFYDRFNRIAVSNCEEQASGISAVLASEILEAREKALREGIEEKKADLAYRRNLRYATTDVRKELNALQEELQEVLEERQKVVSENALAFTENVEVKETFFDFIGNVAGINAGMIEFIASTMSAIFINLISPMCITVVATLESKKGEKNELREGGAETGNPD